MGIDPEFQPHERKLRNAMADGAVNLVAGFIQMDGAYPAFPEESDTPRARRQRRPLRDHPWSELQLPCRPR
jgi:hypothetical protein